MSVITDFYEVSEELAGIQLYRDSSGAAKANLEEVEISGQTILWHCSYRRRYVERIVKKRNGCISGWNVENKRNSGIPITFEIRFDVDDDIQSGVIVIDTYYNGKVASVSFMLDEGELYYDSSVYHGQDKVAVYDSMNENGIGNPYIMSQSEGKTISRIIESAIEIIKVTLEKSICV